MFAIVKRRVRPLVYLLVLAQLLLSAPLVNAFSGAAASHASPACEGHVPPATEHHGCPCCPDGVMTDAGCLAACTAGAAPLQSCPPLRLEAPSIASDERVAEVFGGIADPPLKPPPIR